MCGLQQKSHRAGSGVNYNYYIAATQNKKPTLLLFHGCPDSSSVWNGLIRDYLLPNGFGVLNPDLIGYGHSDKPDDIDLYAGDSICKDIVSILDAENLSKVIVLGHDFGAYLASKMVAYHPDRLLGLITLGTAHNPPSPEPFDFEKIRAMQEQYLGYCSGWYFPLFASDRGYELMDANVGRMFTALHGGGARMKQVCCYPNAFEDWLKDGSGGKEAVMPYANTDEFRGEWTGRLKRDGFRAPMLWYKAVVESLTLAADQQALEAGNYMVKVPYLFVAALEDPLAPAVAVEGLKAQGLLPDVTVKQISASHWLMLEKARETGEAIISWLKDRFEE
ncbi:Putative alpha/beta hydrolase-1, epoxide hydrolase [Septoria linicola]|uniref:Alpha/beta hydrolase-1, epoxide hydrolase n=1 Tax=Septoria linicola TaxID=215465 RepID=A0A9Q9AQG9_9PEZI|nr:Putative alpha/beta hydrolase-1, epoxide hydrolase [Septoria linicola]